MQNTYGGNAGFLSLLLILFTFQARNLQLKRFPAAAEKQRFHIELKKRDSGDSSHLLGQRDSSHLLGQRDSSHLLGQRDSSHLLGQRDSSHLLGQRDSSHLLGQRDSSHLLGQRDSSHLLDERVSCDSGSERYEAGGTAAVIGGSALPFSSCSHKRQ
ncbi:hypothetical protein VZT92_012383 [Zoarces viviparus]|uniref:Uncharacterized protein n=1 Tax=Zoarces viviparus TaxID=48416 RepID=A0AAW1F9L5_ZOAVI